MTRLFSYMFPRVGPRVYIYALADAASSTGGRPNARVLYCVCLLGDLWILRVLFPLAASAALRCVVPEVRFFSNLTEVHERERPRVHSLGIFSRPP